MKISAAVKEQLSILLLEDVVADAVLINHELQRGGLAGNARRVETRDEFLSELENNRPDVILSDHGLPSFDGFTALRIAKDRFPNIPFIFVAQAAGPEEVIQSYKKGANDFVLKSQMSGQLVPAIRNALSSPEQPRKGAQPGAEDYRLFIESHLELALFFIDSEGRILSWNAGAEKITGFKKGEIANLSNLFIAEDQKGEGDWPRKLIDAALEYGSVAEDSVRMRKQDGEFQASIWINALGNHTTDERRLSVVIRDITHLHNAAAETTRLLADTEQRCRKRTAELDAINKELDAFSYSVSHDLRAPLRHIDGFVEMLQHRIEPTLDGASREYLGIITTATRQMGQLIEALLSFSRTSRVPLSKAPVALDKLVQSVVRDLRFEAEGRDVEWVISPLPTAVGDATLLRQVFLNLISNALKFTKTRPKARIEIGELKDEFETALFVRDNGVGFDMQFASKLFGVFQRLHSAPEFQGAGVGLANVRRIIQRHGGRVWAEAVPDAGATFYFSLPRPDADSAPSSSP